MIQQQQRTVFGRAVAAAALMAITFDIAGCAALEGGVPLEPAGSTTSPRTPTDAVAKAEPAEDPRDHVSPADLMFQSTDEPFAEPASSVNVFGEIDGVGASPFTGTAKAGFQQHTFVEEGYDVDPTVSPDGKWLLFSSTRHSDRPDLYLQRVDGLAVTQLTADPADDSFPRFSPDGKQIAFASNRSGSWDIYVMDLDGRNVRQVTRAPVQEIHPSFSPDGGRVVFSAMGARSGQWELWTVDLASLERRMIGYGLFPDWSPRKDKDVIAFQRARQRGTRWFSAWTLELIGGEAKNVTEVAFSSNAAIVAPAWSPDGMRLAFSSILDPQATKSPAAAPRAAGGDIWTINAEGTDRVRLTDGRGVNATPTWSRDGRLYFVSDRGGSESIWSVATGGTSPDSATAAVADQ